MKVPMRVYIVVNDSMDPKHKAICAVARTRKRALELCEDEGDEVVGPYVAWGVKRSAPTGSKE